MLNEVLDRIDFGFYDENGILRVLGLTIATITSFVDDGVEVLFSDAFAENIQDMPVPQLTSQISTHLGNLLISLRQSSGRKLVIGDRLCI